MKRFVFILLTVCAVLLAPLEAFANNGASAVDKADMIYVDESSNGLYQLYYKDQQWYIYHTSTGNYIDLGTTSYGQNYVFWGNYIGYIGISEISTFNYIYDPQTGERSNIQFEDAVQYKPLDIDYEVYDHVISTSWHEPSQSFVRLNLVAPTSHRVEGGDLWLDFYDIEGNHKRSIKMPFRQPTYITMGEIYLVFNQLHIWGDYAVFYSFPYENEPEKQRYEYITFYNINDGTYWFGNGEMFRAIKDRIIILDYDYDDYGNIALQAELYINGECADALWLPVDRVLSGNIIKYNYSENILLFNNNLVFNFAESTAYKKGPGSNDGF